MSKWTIHHNDEVCFVGEQQQALEKIKQWIGDVVDIEVSDDGSEVVDFDTLIEMAKQDDVEVYNCYKGCEMWDEYFSFRIDVAK